MKIVRADSLCRDYFNEELIAESISPLRAEELCEFLNSKYMNEHSETYFKVVADDYELQTFEEY
jgi:hypothetical protein